MLRRTLIVVALLGAFGLRADSWSMPREVQYHSANGEWRVVIVPARVESQLAYFQAKVAEEESGQPVVRQSYARAVVFRKGRVSTWERVAEWRLLNEVAPVSAMIANDGTVVTFDNWHMTGYGEDVVVIYRPDGTLVRQYGLTDLMEPLDVEMLNHSVSSIWWSKTHRIDERQHVLVVQVDALRVEEIPISLQTGEILVRKRALFPQACTLVTWTAHNAGPMDCGDAVRVDDRDLHDHAIETAVPEYARIARRVHIAGKVIVEIVIDEQGRVTGATVLKPLPFGLAESAVEAARGWTFRPFTRNGSVVAGCAQVTFTFTLSP
jgi:TonB family protein